MEKSHNSRVSLDAKKKKKSGVWLRHLAVLGYVARVILPAILRTGRRPVIFSRYGGMGDIICTIPAACELIKRHPGATIIYNCHADFIAVPKLAGMMDRVTSLEPIGTLNHWYGFLLAGFYHFTCGEEKIGERSQLSMIEEFCRQFHVAVTNKHPHFEVSPALQTRARDILLNKGVNSESFITIQPGPSWPVREWPAEKWPQLVAALRERGFTNIVQLGMGRHLHFGKVTVDAVPGVVSLIDALRLEETFAVISLARLHIGIDSGLLHVAAAVGTPAVGIFGMTSPQFRFSKDYIRSFVVSKVECQGCFHRLPRVDWSTGCPNDIQCMKEISTAEVLQSCLTRLAAR